MRGLSSVEIYSTGSKGEERREGTLDYNWIKKKGLRSDSIKFMRTEKGWFLEASMQVTPPSFGGGSKRKKAGEKNRDSIVADRSTTVWPMGKDLGRGAEKMRLLGGSKDPGLQDSLDPYLARKGYTEKGTEL